MIKIRLKDKFTFLTVSFHSSAEDPFSEIKERLDNKGIIYKEVVTKMTNKCLMVEKKKFDEALTITKQIGNDVTGVKASEFDERIHAPYTSMKLTEPIWTYIDDD